MDMKNRKLAGWFAWTAVLWLLAGVPVRADSATSGASPTAIPVPVLESAQQYVVAKVGEDFLDSWMSLNLERSSFRPLRKPHRESNPTVPDWAQCARYVVVYDFRIPGKPYIEEEIVVYIREDGGWFEDPGHREGLPDCVADSGECRFPIDEDAALEIAREAGLTPGIEPWKAEFRWGRARHGTYIWEVKNTLEQFRRGRVVFIDANDGAVLETCDWWIRVE